MRAALLGCLGAAVLLYFGTDQRAWSVVAVAGVVGILATRTWGRIPVGVALALAGLTAALALHTEWVAVAGGLLLAATGVLVARRGRHWRALGARYDAPTGRPPTDADLWSALDRGEDPTV
jgi:hypothetical protein